MEQRKNVLHATQAKKFDATSLHEAIPAGPRPPAATGPLVKAKIAKGRSLHLPDPSAPKEFVGYASVLIAGTSVLKEITHAPIKVAGPGTTVELPQSEVDRLRQLGFLEWPDKRFITNEQASLATGVANDPRAAAGPIHQQPQRDEHTP